MLIKKGLIIIIYLALASCQGKSSNFSENKKTSEEMPAANQKDQKEADSVDDEFASLPSNVTGAFLQIFTEKKATSESLEVIQGLVVVDSAERKIHGNIDIKIIDTIDSPVETTLSPSKDARYHYMVHHKGENLDELNEKSDASLYQASLTDLKLDIEPVLGENAKPFARSSSKLDLPPVKQN